MCFSATASFTTAAVTAVFGVMTLSRPKTWREMPLAMTPLLFSVQQAIEGLLWLDLDHHQTVAAGAHLSVYFLVIAEVIWPIYAPVAVLLVEQEHRRKWPMLVCLGCGIGVSVYLLSVLVNSTDSAQDIDGHIVYSIRYGSIDLLSIAYLAATGGVILLSSHRTIWAFGIVVVACSLVSHYFYWGAFVSVWCFFSAISSILILGYFWRARPPGQATSWLPT